MVTLYEERFSMMISQTQNIMGAREKAEFICTYEGVSAYDKVNHLLVLMFNDTIREPYLDVCRRLIGNHPGDFKNNGFKENDGLEKKVRQILKSPEYWVG